MHLAQQIEALLFALGKPLSYAELAKMLGVSAAEIQEAAALLRHAEDRGVAVVDDGKTLELRVAGAAAEAIERVRKEEYDRDIGKAGLEALAILLYRGPSTRAEIDFIRGVNSSQTLRTLSVRGLVRKIPNPRDERSFLYEPTTELLAELGATNAAALPEYEQVREKLAALEAAYRQAEAEQAKRQGEETIE